MYPRVFFQGQIFRFCLKVFLVIYYYCYYYLTRTTPPGNIACISVFSSKSVDLKPSFANILKCLSIYDICLLVRTGKIIQPFIVIVLKGFLFIWCAPKMKKNIEKSA